MLMSRNSAEREARVGPRMMATVLGVGAAPVITPVLFWVFLIQDMPWAALASVVLVHTGALLLSRI